MRFGDTVSKWRDFTLIGFCWFPTSEGADIQYNTIQSFYVRGAVRTHGTVGMEGEGASNQDRFRPC